MTLSKQIRPAARVIASAISIIIALWLFKWNTQ